MRNIEMKKRKIKRTRKKEKLSKVLFEEENDETTNDYCLMSADTN